MGINYSHWYLGWIVRLAPHSSLPQHNPCQDSSRADHTSHPIEYMT